MDISHMTLDERLTAAAVIMRDAIEKLDADRAQAINHVGPEGVAPTD